MVRHCWHLRIGIEYVGCKQSVLFVKWRIAYGSRRGAMQCNLDISSLQVTICEVLSWSRGPMNFGAGTNNKDKGVTSMHDSYPFHPFALFSFT